MTISSFAEAIQRRLDANAWKGDTWRTVPIEDLADGLLREVEEARAAGDRESAIGEWADVAAYAFFLWSRAREASR